MMYLPDSFERIKFFENYIEELISKQLRKEYRNVNVRFYNHYNSGYIFKILYFPTGKSCADLPKTLPDSVIKKLKVKRDLLNASYYPVEEIDKITGKKITITYCHLQKTKMNKKMKAACSEYVVMNNACDFFNIR